MSAPDLPSHEEMLVLAASLSDHDAAVDEFEPALLDALLHTSPRAACLEIGVGRGGSALLILWHVLSEHKGRRFLTVDHGGELSDERLRKIERDWVPSGRLCRQHTEMDQHEWIDRGFLPYRPRRLFGFVHHDGQHGDLSVSHDLTGLAPHIVSGGVVAVDDAHLCTNLDFAFLGLRPAEYTVRQHGCEQIAFYRKE